MESSFSIDELEQRMTEIFLGETGGEKTELFTDIDPQGEFFSATRSIGEWEMFEIFSLERHPEIRRALEMKTIVQVHYMIEGARSCHFRIFSSLKEAEEEMKGIKTPMRLMTFPSLDIQTEEDLERD